jgi:hypothetical protein
VTDTQFKLALDHFHEYRLQPKIEIQWRLRDLESDVQLIKNKLGTFLGWISLRLSFFLSFLPSLLMTLATPSFSYCLSLHRQKLYSDGQFVRLNWDRSTP